MGNIFLVPQKILSGQGSIQELGQHIQGKGKKALIVTDKFMVQFGNVEKVTNVLDKVSIAYAVYDGANSEPTDKIVDGGVAMYKEQQCDFLIALGGGSPIDTAKAIGFMAKSPGRISDYLHKTIDVEVPYLVAIPTTAGTGSEATKFTIIADTVNNVKMLLAGPSILPSLALLDPIFTMTAPPKVTAATGVDALTHAIEAYTSRKAQPLSDIFALSAIRRIHKNLPICFKDGKAETARLEMSIGSHEAGIAFNNASVTLVHGMSRPIGALFHIAHGVSNAVLLPACLEFAIAENTVRFAKIGRIMGVADEKTTDAAAAAAMVSEGRRFCKELEIPTMTELGVKKEDFMGQLDKMAEDALDSGSPQNTFRVPNKEQIIGIYQKLF